MAVVKPFELSLKKSLRSIGKDVRAERKAVRHAVAKQTMTPGPIIRALKATKGANKILALVPNLGLLTAWQPVAFFSACRKSGTALWLDLWDADHFDGFTDMSHCLSDCRAWFSADGYTIWGSGQTKTGRVNCYFNVPASGNYVCNAQLQSFGGPAMVECLIDSSSFGPLPFGGSINQPHPCQLSAGGHSFRIRQLSGSFFFVSLSVWKV
jgi:hypothetical protein